MARYVLSEKDYRRVQDVLSWFDKIGKGLHPRHRRRAITIGGSGGAGIRLAEIAEVPGNADYIKASLLNESTGIAVTDGAEFEVTVYARISGGARLDRASPQIAIGTVFEVRQHYYDNNGTPEQRWWFVQNFQAVETYIGENP